MPWLPSSSSPSPMTRSSGSAGRPPAAGSRPTWTCRPRRRRLSTDATQVSRLPSASMDTCTPPVASRTARGASDASAQTEAPKRRAAPPTAALTATPPTPAPPRGAGSAHRGDGPGALVPRYGGRADGRVVPLPAVPVAPAQAGGRHPDHGTVRRWYRIGYLTDLWRGTELFEDDSTHVSIVRRMTTLGA